MNWNTTKSLKHFMNYMRHSVYNHRKHKFFFWWIGLHENWSCLTSCGKYFHVAYKHTLLHTLWNTRKSRYIVSYALWSILQNVPFILPLIVTGLSCRRHAFAGMPSDRTKLVLFSLMSLKIKIVQQFLEGTKCRI